MPYRPSGPRRIVLPGHARPPDNPPLGTRPTDDLYELDQAAREDLLAGRIRDPWDAHDEHMASLLAHWQRAQSTPDLRDLDTLTDQEESA